MPAFVLQLPVVLHIAIPCSYPKKLSGFENDLNLLLAKYGVKKDGVEISIRQGTRRQLAQALAEAMEEKGIEYVETTRAVQFRATRRARSGG
jgi:hypothetical protein